MDYCEFTTFSILLPDQYKETDIKEVFFQFLASTARELQIL